MKKFYNVNEVEAVMNTMKEAVDVRYREATQENNDIAKDITAMKNALQSLSKLPGNYLETIKRLERELASAQESQDGIIKRIISANDASLVVHSINDGLNKLEQHSFDSDEVTTPSPWESEFAVPEHEDTLELFIYVQPDEEYTNSIHDNAEAAYENYTRTITLTKGRLINAWQDYEHSYISITNVERRKLMWDTLKQIHKSYVTGKKVKHEGTFYYKPDGYRRINIVLDNGVNTIPDWARQAATEIIGEDDGSCRCEQVQAGATAGTCTCVHCGRVFGSWSDWNAYTRYERDQEIK